MLPNYYHDMSWFMEEISLNFSSCIDIQLKKFLRVYLLKLGASHSDEILKMLQHCQLRSVTRISYCDFAFFGRLFYIYSDGKTRFAYSDNIFTPWSSHDELNVVCSKKSITPLDLIIDGGKIYLHP